MSELEVFDRDAHRALLRRIIGAYDSRIARAYSVARFLIININILHILGLCLRGKGRILDVGCGFGLFGCYFSARFPDIQYHGIDRNERRIAAATLAAERLGLRNAVFECADASSLALGSEYDGVFMLDLMHHLPPEGKRHTLDEIQRHLAEDGRLVIKDVLTRPRWRLWFTWALDVVMTRSFDMWYIDTREFRNLVGEEFRMESYPIADWMPYPHVVHLFDRVPPTAAKPTT